MNRFIILYLAYVIILFVKCNAKINVNIKVSSNRAVSGVNFTGDHKKLITDKEIRLYNVSEDNLKYGVKVELGKAPDDIFLKDPTRYGDLYRKYKWNEVRRSLQIQSAEIDDIINENTVVTTIDHINNTTSKLKKNIRIYKNVHLNVKSLWSDKGMFVDDIPYRVNVSIDLQKFVFENKWRKDNYKTEKMTFGVNSFGIVNIEPGKAVTMKLLGKRTIIIAKLTYVARLTGQIITNYARLYGKYHFYAPSISNIMKAAKLKNEILTTEYVEIVCYTDPYVEVRDKSTGKKIPIKYPNKAFRYKKTIK